MWRAGWMVVLSVMVCNFGRSQEMSDRHIAVPVSYVTSRSVYLDAGTQHSVAIGDTGVLYRDHRRAGLVVVTGVSSSSSVARLQAPADSVSVGDTVVFVFRPRTLATGTGSVDTERESVRPPPSVNHAGNSVHGRVSMQYSAAGEIGGVSSLSRPSLLVYLSAIPFHGSNLSLTLNGRIDGSLGSAGNHWSTQGTTVRLYSLAIEIDDVRRWGGFSLGRITSAYVSGLGLVDGAQAVVRWKAFTLGGLGGFQPDYRTSGFNDQTQKVAGFLSVSWPSSRSARGSSTMAYGQQLFRGKLDRDFLYLQNSAAFSNALFLFQSTEIDLHRNENGKRTGDFRLTNTFLTVNYQAFDWLSVNLGYDASRRIDFMETERNLVDSLLDKDLRQGFRGGAYFRLPMNLAVSLLGGYRAPAGGLSSGYSAGSGVHISNIGGSGISTGGQYMHVKGPYSNGDDIGGELEYAPFSILAISVRWNRYAFTPSGTVTNGSRSTVMTVSGNICWSVSSGWYVSVFADRVQDTSVLLYRCYAETGYHF